MQWMDRGELLFPQELSLSGRTHSGFIEALHDDINMYSVNSQSWQQPDESNTTVLITVSRQAV